jgi:small ligand-binding sensory domain FIST
VIGPRREVEQTPGVSLFAAHIDSPVRPVHLRAGNGDAGWEIDGLPADLDDIGSVILLPDPFTFPVDALLSSLRAGRSELAVIGGLASAANEPGGNRLVLDDAVHTEGAVGVLLGQDVSPRTVVSQGCRPIGQPYTVTAADRNLIHELGGRPALERLMTIIERLSPTERLLAEQGLHCGVVIDESKAEFRRGDFLIRGVLGADAASGAVAVGEVVPVGSTIQFQVRDAASADEDLRELLAGRSARGALVFTCNGRGRHMFGAADHDATVVGELLGTSTVAGMFCAGEIGPVGGRNALHGFTASVALFR